MLQTGKNRKPKTNRRELPEFEVVEVRFNPAPDAQDRLRRIFTLLAKHIDWDEPIADVERRLSSEEVNAMSCREDSGDEEKS